MSKIKAKCSFGGCAERYKIQNVDEGTTVCPHCGMGGSTWRIIKPKPKYNWKYILGIFFAIIAVGLFWWNCDNNVLKIGGSHKRNIEVGKTDTLFASIDKGDSVIWEVTEGEELVGVVGINDSTGVVTAKKEGLRAIVVASLYEKPDVKDTCIYKVNPAPISISFDSTSITLVVGKSMPLSPRVEPNELSTGIKWNSADSTKVTVTPKGVIKGIAVGETKITAEIKDKKVVINVEVIKDTTSSNNDNNAVNQGGSRVSNPGGTTSQGGQTGGGGTSITTIDLGYATYYGPINTSRQPHGLGGELKFKRNYEIDLKKASGERVAVKVGDIMRNCKFDNGRLVQGLVVFSNGEQRWITIGS